MSLTLVNVGLLNIYSITQHYGHCFIEIRGDSRALLPFDRYGRENMFSFPIVINIFSLPNSLRRAQRNQDYSNNVCDSCWSVEGKFQLSRWGVGVSRIASKSAECREAGGDK